MGKGMLRVDGERFFVYARVFRELSTLGVGG